MPVIKYRSIQEMSEKEDSFWIPPETPEHHAAIHRVLNVASLFGIGKKLPRGVFKFRSVVEADALREKWERREIPAAGDTRQ